MTKAATMTLAQALEEIYAAGFGTCQKYGSIDWRMGVGSNDTVTFTAWPTHDPAETRHLMEFEMRRDGTVARTELARALATGAEIAEILRREIKK